MYRHRVMLMIAAMLLLSTSSWGQVTNPSNGHQYQLISQGVTWYKAADSAQKLGGYLVTITSAQEQAFVETLIYPQGVFWIGATDSLVEGDWRWVSGEPWNYSNWFSGEPSNGMGLEHFATILTKFGYTGQWNDYGGNGSAAFIVEWGSSIQPSVLHINYGPGSYGNKVLTPTPTVYWTYFDDPPSTQVSFEIEFGTDNDWSSAELWAPGPLTSSDTSITYAGLPLTLSGTYYLRLRANNGSGWGDWAISNFTYQVPGARIYVPDDYPTIASAFSAAKDFDTVIVRPGVYSGSGFVDLTLPAGPVTLTSEAGAGLTIIDAQGHDGYILKAGNGTDSATVISGLSFINADSTAVILAGSAPIIDACIFSGNVTTNKGAALSVYNAASPIIRNCTFERNFSKWCGGALSFHGAGTPKVQNCRFVDNRAPFGGAAISVYSDVTFANCFFVRNYANGDGAASYSQNFGIHRFTNCTFDGNWGSGANIATINSQAGLYVDHSIIANSAGLSVYAVEGAVDISCTDIFGNAGGDWTPSIASQQGVNDNFSQDPLFCDPTYLTLQAGSPCAPAGNSCGVLIGAGAEGCTAAYPLAAHVNFGANTEGNTVSDPVMTIYWSYFDNPASSQSAFEIQVGTDPDWTYAETWSSGQISSADTSVSYGGPMLDNDATYFLRMRVYNGSVWGEWNVVAFATHRVRVIHVPSDYATIQDALVAAVDDDTIVVAPGTYSGAGFINVTVPLKRVVLTSEGDPMTTIIDATGSNQSILNFLVAHDSLTVVRGFTFANAGTHAMYIGQGSSPIIENCIFTGNTTSDKGAAISLFRARTPIIRNCIFDHNSSTWCGGALSFDDVMAPKVVNCRFEYNSAPYGGAVISVYADVSFTGCLFLWNSASGDGAASYNQNYGIHRFANCTFYGNYGTQPTMAVIRVLEDAFLTNCIIAGTTVGRAINASAAPVTISCTDIFANAGGNWTSDIQAQQAANGNLSVDPQFCDESSFAVTESSPCAPANNSCGELIGAGPAGCSSIRVTAVRVDGMAANMHVVGPTPVFDWLSTVSQQTAFEIAVGTDNDWLTAEMWAPAIFELSDQTVTYGGSPLNEATTYYGRVRIFDGIEWSAWFRFTFYTNRTPTAPSPMIPGKGEWTSLTPTLMVEGAVDDPGENLTYEFQIFTDSTDVAPVVSVNDRPGSEVVTWTVPSPLSDNTAYYWRVRAWDGYAHSVWSPFFWFGTNTAPEPPQVFTLIGPPALAGRPIYTLLPTFTWNAAVDPDPFDSVTYELELAVDPNFLFKLTIDSITGTAYSVTDSLALKTHYWWRMYARDKTGRTVLSSAKDFWTWTSGDCDGNNNVDIGDVSAMVDALFISATLPGEHIAYDVNGDCAVDIDDLTALLRHLFLTFEPLEPGCQ